MAAATSGWRVPDSWPLNAKSLRPCRAMSAMILSLSSGSGGLVTSGDECATRRSSSTLGGRKAPGLMPSYPLPGLQEDEAATPGLLPWVETHPSQWGTSRRG
ncbi:hypothetical protein GCM10010302_33540 [Streptomyces polychromogenes]|uniref:Uncharacterized protein n=1 Tax=Streptomyces polychromogenes TaxID=67342 RepID=A0ABP3F586_9ACTN